MTLIRTLSIRVATALSAIALGLAAGVVPALAVGPNDYTLFGDATKVHPGNASATAVQLRSAPAPALGYGGIDFAVPAGMTFNQVTNLATDYNFTVESCGGGSPRFQVNVDGKNIFVYVGPPPNYTGCPPNTWVTTGNLVTPVSLVDTSQLPGGAFYDTVAAAGVKYGTHVVTGIQLVADGSFFFPTTHTQAVFVDNVQINAITYTFEPPAPSGCDQQGNNTGDFNCQQGNQNGDHNGNQDGNQN